MATQTAKLQTYIWEGKDRSGKTARGELMVANQLTAKAQLRKQGIVVKTV